MKTVTDIIIKITYCKKRKFFPMNLSLFSCDYEAIHTHTHTITPKQCFMNVFLLFIHPHDPI